MVQCEKTRRAQKAIQNAFIELMMDKPYEKITVMDLVQKSEYSRNTFYHYYIDKDDLVSKIVHKEAESFSEIVKVSIARCHIIEIGKGIYEPAYHLLEHVMQNRNLYKLIFQSMLPGYSLENFVEMVASKGRKDTDIKDQRSSELNRDFYYYSNTYWLMAQIMYWEKKDFPYSIEYMAQQITYLLAPSTYKSISLKKV